MKGFLYVATGPRFIAEACASARRVKELMAGVPMALASDVRPEKNFFDHWIPIENPRGTFADKIAPLAKTPFEQTVFLDTDTYLCEPVPELFELLERCDIAMAHAPMRITGSVPVPSSFPECNSGVVAYNINERTRSLFSNWEKFYAEQLASTGQPDDQPALRRALWESDARLAILPPEYNFRFALPSFAGRGKVKILHGRHVDMPGLAQRLNRSGSPRVFLPRLREAGRRHFGILSFPGKMLGTCVAADAFCAKWLGKIWDGLQHWFAGKGERVGRTTACGADLLVAMRKHPGLSDEDIRDLEAAQTNDKP
ncbi:MAG: hypothetical protein ACKOFH_12760, partial [Chthoniobacterales bacterium]